MSHLLRNTNMISRLKNGLLAVAFVSTQFVAPLLLTNIASAAGLYDACTKDVQGADDQPGQKDLNEFCTTSGDTGSTIHISWNWDATDFSGSNTGDACALFDTNSDTKIDYAVCVTVSGKPAAQTSDSPRVYSCNNSDVDNCKGATAAAATGVTCTVDSAAADVFGTAGRKPSEPRTSDTAAQCTIALTSVGGVASALKDVCSYPSEQPTSDPSDCVITTTGPQHTPSATIEVKKVLSPSNDSGTFNLRINGSSYTTGGNGIDTGPISVTPGSSAKVEETAADTNTSLDNYTTKVDCYNGTTLLTGSGSRTGSTSRSMSFTTNDGDAIVCTFTNTRQMGSVRVIKDVMNDNGGTKTATHDFTFQNNMGGAQTFAATITRPDPDGERLLSLPVGSAFSITEDQANSYGYSTSYAGTCSGTVMTAEQTCTITNNDQAPLLNVTKHVLNDNGGAKMGSDFSLYVNNTQLLPQDAKKGGGEVADNSVTYEYPNAAANTAYTVREDASNGYAQESIVCLDEITHATVAQPVVLQPGQEVDCTITNNDVAPLLTVTKTVENDDGGTLQVSDFPLYVGQLQVASGTQTSLNAGNYVVAETSNSSSYLAGQWGGDCDALGNIMLQVGGVYACTITNDDIPAQITVTKQITNNNGGAATIADFPLYVGATQVVSGTANTFNANQSYTVSEQMNVSGYTQTSLSCTDDATGAELGATFTPALNQHISCVIVNNDVAPTLTLVKHVTNDNGGTATIDDFLAQIDGTNTSWNTAIALAAGSHSATEAALAGGAGYQASGWTGDCASDGSITLHVGENKTCEITNDDIAPTVTVVKHVVNDNSGVSTASDFTLWVTADAVSQNSFVGSETGTSVSFNVGSYQVAEAPAAGYQASYGADCAGSLTVGQSKTCTVTNNDVAHPNIHVVKTGPAAAHEGDTIPYTFTVTNTGDTSLSAPAVEDSIAGTATYKDGDTNNDGTLAASETWHYTASYTIPEDQTADVTNTVEACASDPDNTQVCDQDSHTLDVLHPGIHVEKTGPAAANEGETVTYTFRVTNTGDTPLASVTVDDDIAGDAHFVRGDTNDNDKLDAGEVWIFRAQYQIPIPQRGPVRNTGTACAQDDLEQVVCDNDHHTLQAHDATITVSKDAVPNDPQDFHFVLYQLPPVLNLGGGAGDLLRINDSDEAGQAPHASHFKLDDDSDATLSSSKLFAHVVPGTYYLHEKQLKGWDLTSLSCKGATVTRVDENRAFARFTVLPGAQVSCSFTNTKRASVTIIKDAQPDAAQAFGFSTTLGGNAKTFSLTDNGSDRFNSRTFAHVRPGTYTVNENSVDGWSLSGIRCSTGAAATTNGSQLTLALTPGDTVTCTFTNMLNKKKPTGEVLGISTTATPTATPSTPVQQPTEQLANTGAGETTLTSAVIASAATFAALVLTAVSRRSSCRASYR